MFRSTKLSSTRPNDSAKTITKKRKVLHSHSNSNSPAEIRENFVLPQHDEPSPFPLNGPAKSVNYQTSLRQTLSNSINNNAPSDLTKSSRHIKKIRVKEFGDSDRSATRQSIPRLPIHSTSNSSENINIELKKTQSISMLDYSQKRNYLHASPAKSESGYDSDETRLRDEILPFDSDIEDAPDFDRRIGSNYSQNVKETPQKMKYIQNSPGTARPFFTSNSSIVTNDTDQTIAIDSLTPDIYNSLKEMDDSELSLSMSRPDLGLPQSVVKTYANYGITALYQWQMECLFVYGVLDGSHNLIYSAPTSAGKTMVAELLVLRRVFETRKKAIIILPFVAIVNEKTNYIKKMFHSLNLNVVGYFGNLGGSTSFDNVDIAICTIEKANSLVNKIMEEGKMDSVGIVVVDELHMIGDDSRGYLLELLLTKLRYIVPDRLQIIGMSATLPNINTLATWLNARLYLTDYRPVPLFEYVKVEDKIYDSNFELVRQLNYPKDSRDPDTLVPLVWETVKDNNSVLIFCATRDNCEKVVRNITTCMQLPTLEETILQRRSVVKELSRTPGGADPTLEMTVMSGCAYHHSGLTVEEREIIEDAYRAGTIKVLAATSTLAAGVNLPARRVIFRSPMLGRNYLDASSYKQMKGRAGRKGQDTMGESILICQEKDAKFVRELVESELEPVLSCLTADRKGMKRALLEVIVNGVASSMEDIANYVRSTLLYAQEGEFNEKVIATTVSALNFLVESGMILPQTADSNSQPNVNCPEAFLQLPQAFTFTRLGQATVCSALSPEESKVVYTELAKALKYFVLEDELHIVYQITPTYQNHEPNWSNYLNIYISLPEIQRNIADAIGISESFLMRQARGSTLSRTNEEDLIHKRFYAALMLNDLVHEVEFRHVLRKYEVNRGTVQSLQTLSSTFSGMVTIFCQKLGWTNLELLLHQFQERVNFGVEKELVELAKVPFVKGFWARILWQAGFKTIASLACSTPEELFEHLKKAKSSKNESEQDKALLRKIEFRAAHSIIRGAQEILESEQKELLHTASTLSKELEKVRKLRSKRECLKPGVRQGGYSKPRRSEYDGSTSNLFANLLNIEVVSNNNHRFLIFLDNLRAQSEFSFQFVTCESKIESLLFCWEKNRVYFVDLSDKTIANLWKTEIAKAFQLNSSKICSDSIFTARLMLQLGITFSPSLLDPNVAAWCLHPEEKEQVLSRALGDIADNVVKSVQSVKLGIAVDRQRRVEDAALKLSQTFLLMKELQLRLATERLFEQFIDVEMPIISVLAQMEVFGIGFVHEDFNECAGSLVRKLESLEREAYAAAGEQFKITSYIDVGRIIYDKLKLGVSDKPLIGSDSLSKSSQLSSSSSISGNRPTGRDVLMRLTHLHPLPGIIIEYRRIASLLSSIVIPMENAKVLSPVYQMFRIHCRFDPFTLTGRIATFNPNLQNIPKSSELISSPQQDNAENLFRVRNCFGAANGCTLLSIDYSQLELRVIAHLSSDSALVSALCGGGDIFVNIASLWKGIRKEKVDQTLRQKTKKIVYGVIYGISAHALAQELGESKGIWDFRQKVIQNCSETGWVQTILGRRRYLPAIHSENSSERSQAEKQAINTTIQGSAADLVKKAMLLIDDRLKNQYGCCWYDSSNNVIERKPKNIPRMIMQIHDELLFEIPIKELEQSKQMIVDSMKNVMTLNVPLELTVKSGTQWGDLK
ncbi:hypothetical protein HK098_006492 [Nowakowskiella sp. JEL0407]|nr:hypothetical protein HK098_006492 [Nowakowskiella sp. JEL0407]